MHVQWLCMILIRETHKTRQYYIYIYANHMLKASLQYRLTE